MVLVDALKHMKLRSKQSYFEHSLAIIKKGDCALGGLFLCKQKRYVKTRCFLLLFVCY